MGKKRQAPVTDAQIMEMYQQTQSLRKSSKLLGIGEATIYRVLLKNNIPRTGERVAREKKTRFLGSEMEIRSLYEGGMTFDQLAEKFGGGTDDSFRSAIRRAGGGPRVNAPFRVKDGEVETIKRLHDSGLGQARISVEMGRSQSFVARVMRLNGIQRHEMCREKHRNWKGGRVEVAGGYWRVRVELDDQFHCMADHRGYVLEHRLVMARSLRRPLTPHETVHHINGDPSDNRLENLQLRKGRHGNGVVMYCLDCGSHNIGTTKIAGH